MKGYARIVTDTADRATETIDSVDRVVSEMLVFINRRGYTAGERLPSERDLAVRFAASRGAVREALTKLQAMRVIERRASSGIFLCREPGGTSLEALVLSQDLGLPMSHKDIAECIEVRRMLELQAVRLASERRTADDLAALDTILTATEAAMAAGQPFDQHDYNFHMTIFRATQNDILVRVVNPFYLLSRARRAAYFRDPARCCTSHAQHLGIVAAIRGSDPTAAAALMDQHIGRVERYFIDRNAAIQTVR